MAGKKGSVTVKVEFAVSTEKKEDLPGVFEEAKRAILERITVPKRVSVEGARVFIG